MGRLADIVNHNGHDQFEKFLGTSIDAFKPVPHGGYPCHVAKGGFHTSGKGTEGYRLTFEILEGEYAGRRLFKTYYFTAKARAYSRGELAKFGLVEERHFTESFPDDKVIRCMVLVSLSRFESWEANEIQRITDIDIQLPSGGASSAKTLLRKPPETKGMAGQRKPATKKAKRKNGGDK